MKTACNTGVSDKLPAEECAANDSFNDTELVDIRTIFVDKTLPKQERITEFIKQIKNPYRFKCGKFTVSVRFAENGPTLEECLQRLTTV